MIPKFLKISSLRISRKVEKNNNGNNKSRNCTGNLSITIIINFKL